MEGENVSLILENKILKIQKIIGDTVVAIQKFKLMDIYGANELNICVSTLEKLFNDTIKVYEIFSNNLSSNKEIESLINNIKTDLLIVIKNFGTENLDDLIYLILGTSNLNNILNDELVKDKYILLKKFAHPINFKSVTWKQDTENQNKKYLVRNRIIEDTMIVENSENLDCFDLARTSKSFQTKVYGIKISLHDYSEKKTYIIYAVVDDVLISCISSIYLNSKLKELELEKKDDKDFKESYWIKYIESLTIKELFIYNSNELYTKFLSILNQLILFKQKTISQIVKEFINNELYGQRNVIIQLLIRSEENEFQYLAYLLYDLLSNDNNNNIDTFEQTLLYDSFPWNIKKCFGNAMKQTIDYTNSLYNFDNNKIPLEQQICLLKADESVKEKAIVKLKEIKSKSEDSGTKARQYLDGLLKIPFGIFKIEKILKISQENQEIFKQLTDKIEDAMENDNKFIKDKYTNIELAKYLENFEIEKKPYLINKRIEIILNHLNTCKKEDLMKYANCINSIQKKKIIKLSNKKNQDIILELENYITLQKNNNYLMEALNNLASPNNKCKEITEQVTNNIIQLKTNLSWISDYMNNVNEILNESVYGHVHAKRQIERIIGQWINGEKSGYCFGFEGPPGVGKTSLAKRGIANCLKDENGVARPFSFIAVGGSANGSTLEGHNYTYVGSTWGKIVDILIDTKCMNPIIFIDELDKISKTEHGKELIGILTHLCDSTQNDSFQDKYFTGIDLDLSKALFIFSYNDVELIDRILLDRIHRIKFKHLSLQEKLVITNNFIIPEINTKMGLHNVINLDNNTLEFIINTYTNEPGVRKLKELLFEIIGEINLKYLDPLSNLEIPITITIEDVKNIYLKKRPEHRIKEIPEESKVGVINGLWANGVGQGGLLPIEVKFFPCNNFLELKLTGMQGDVMKESMNVAKTLAWELISSERKSELLNKFEKEKAQGIHIHVPEGATPKDGPSGGAAITSVVYSLLSGKKINNIFAMTGEITLQGKVTAIGGLDLKILGGIKGGVKKFIYPKENSKDFNLFKQELDDDSVIKNIEFYEVENINEVLELIIV